MKNKNSELYRAFNVIIREAIKSTNIAGYLPVCLKQRIHQAILRKFLTKLIDMSKSPRRAPSSFMDSLKELGSKEGSLNYIMRELGVENVRYQDQSASEPEYAEEDPSASEPNSPVGSEGPSASEPEDLFRA